MGLRFRGFSSGTHRHRTTRLARHPQHLLLTHPIRRYLQVSVIQVWTFYSCAAVEIVLMCACLLCVRMYSWLPVAALLAVSV